MQGVLDDVAEDDVWLHEAEFSDNRFDEPEAWDLPMRIGEHLTELFRAYGDLRFDHQIQYADFKLEKSGDFFASAVRQHEILRGVSLACVLIVLVAHLLIGLPLVLGWSNLSGNLWPDIFEVLILWSMSLVLAACRT